VDVIEPEPRRATRPAEGVVLAGVCAGIAEHLSIPVLWVRVVFALGILLNGVTVIAYAILWRFMPLATPTGQYQASSERRRNDLIQTAAIGSVLAGVAIFLVANGTLDVSGYTVPVALLVGGIAVVWRLVDDATMNSWMTRTSGPGFLVRLAIGLGLVGLAIVSVVTFERGFRGILEIGAAFLIAFLGGVLLIGPWAMKLRSDLVAERISRARIQERADVADHLHDSVLQTLALLQKNAHDPAYVVTAARRQERELRSWLLGQEADSGSSFGAAIRSAAAEVEDTYHVSVEVVLVGDAAMNDVLTTIVAAAREALVNAAKHSQALTIDVFAELQPTRIDVFVRDRGQGFDPEKVDASRRGIDESIKARMKRHGGEASIQTAIGEGTEVHLSWSNETREEA